MEECFKGEEKDRNEGKDWGGLTEGPQQDWGRHVKLGDD